jgi:DMSO/TMAO reductase YedYZ molybdopterin-dependent catalytic subunit
MNTIGRGEFIGGLAAGLVLARLDLSAETMRVVNHRPYDWATLLSELGKSFYTPNEIFFIRSHMGPPPSIDMHSWHLSINGLVEHPLNLALDDIKKFPKHEVPVVLECSGNGRWYFGEAYPKVSHPAGAQWRFGGTGNARWTGARVRDVFAKAGVKPNAHYSTNFGLDNPILAQTPKFTRGIELEKLMDEDTILAYEMNGTPLPYYHGYPLRLVVPGWAADHSVKWITNMTLTDTLTNNFWTAVAYRYPNKLGPPGVSLPPTAEHPITALNVRSIITSPNEGASIRTGTPLVVSGFAFSGGGAYATRVDLSFDRGRTWHSARLDQNVGKYSWRTFTSTFTPSAPGKLTIMARATDSFGAVQPRIPPWNQGGYLWNGIQEVSLKVVSA